MEITAEKIYETYKRKGYKFFNSSLKGTINVNIFGIRDRKGTMNTFCDYIGVIWKTAAGEVKMRLWPATTKPGTYYFQNPMTSNGTCIIKEGQYLSCYKIGVYKTYKALRQIKELDYYRDFNRDGKADYIESTVQKGIRNTHIHRAGANSTYVNNWSAGCQVFKRESDFNEFMDIIMNSAKVYGDTFSYTLFNMEEIC